MLKFPIYVDLQSLRTVFIEENSADPDEMPHSVTSHLGFHCFSHYTFRGFPYRKIKIQNGQIHAC